MPAYEGFAALEKNGWTDEGIASGYIELFSSASDLAIPDLIAGIKSGACVLDLCCGQGNVTEALLARRREVTRAQILEVLAWEQGFVTWAELLAEHLPLAARLRQLAPAPADPAPFAAARDRLKLIRARFDTNG